MKRYGLIVLFALLTVLTVLTFPAPPATGAPAKRKAAKTPQPALSPIERMFKAAGQVGIQAVSLQSGRVLFEYHPNDPLVPASLVKILTSSAALRDLGPDHHFNTSVWAATGPQGGEIPGDIWIASEGDIFFTAENARALAQRVKDLGIRSVRGNVYTDGSFFKPEKERICLDEKCSDSYNPTVSGTALEFNSIVFRIVPGPKPGAPLKVEWSPQSDYVRLTNQGTTGARAAKTPVSLRSLGATGDGNERFQVTGGLPTAAGTAREFRFTVDDPAGFAANTFKSLLVQAGVEVRGCGRQRHPCAGRGEEDRDL